ncbi:MAG: class II aldolase [Acidobacteriota bacterium]|nr:class II aldolase [Acidobacteriota bacterium]
MSSRSIPEIGALAAISARIGSDPLLVQAATGNTSIKIGDVMWIKASGQWLARAQSDDIMIPVALSETRRRIAAHIDPAGQSTLLNGRALGTSVETAMHAVLPWPVVLHVHSVNTIAWAVRRDGERELETRLRGLEWKWIPFVPSGLPLARAIEDALLDAPGTRVLVLANHGLVVCGEACESADELLNEVERRVAIEPREGAAPRWEILRKLTANGLWEIPEHDIVHGLATDALSRHIVTAGVLYPCQAIFLTPQIRPFPSSVTLADLATAEEPFVLVEDSGIVVRPNLNPAATATLRGLAQIAKRVPASAPIQYLGEDQVRDLLCADVYHYRSLVEGNSSPVSPQSPVTTF